MSAGATTDSQNQPQSSLAVTVVAAAALLIAAAVFIGETESWYLTFKAFHVVAAVIWVGGGTFLTLIALSAERARDSDQMLALVRQGEWGARVFIPASFATLGFGIAMVVNADLDWGAFWILFGLIAWAISTAVGILYLTPQLKRLNNLMAERGVDDPQTEAVLQRILLVARLDIVLLTLIVVDMTVKPFS